MWVSGKVVNFFWEFERFGEWIWKVEKWFGKKFEFWKLLVFGGWGGDYLGEWLVIIWGYF